MKDYFKTYDEAELAQLKQRKHKYMCRICGCWVDMLTQHHVTPKVKCKRIKRFYIEMCWDCHKTLHENYTNRYLTEKFSMIKPSKSYQTVRGLLRSYKQVQYKW